MNRFYVRDDSEYVAPTGGRMAFWSVVDRTTSKRNRVQYRTRKAARDAARTLNARGVAELFRREGVAS